MTTDTAPSADDALSRDPDAPGTTRPLLTAVGTSLAYRWLLLVTGIVGLVGSIELTLDDIAILKNPNYVPSCSINPIISCGSVIRSEQAHVFGFPNPLIGLGAFSVVITLAVAVLAGARLPGWFWLGLQVGTVFGIGFITWLQYQTLYVIGALCPYCMAVWAAVIALFWYTLLHNIRRGSIPVPDALRRAAASSYHWVVPFLWYLVIAMLILNRFWYYWRTLV